MINQGKPWKPSDLLQDKKFALPAMLAVLLLINIPYFFYDLVPRHDTSYVFQSFYFFYNELFLNNELTGWIPYHFFGVHSDINLMTSLSPSLAFVGLFGWLLRIKDVLFLFNVGIFLDQLILLLGTYLLSRTIFKKMATTIFVCLSVIGSTVLIMQIYWSFRIYYLLPLIFYFIHLFFRTYRPQYLLLSMFVFIISTSGNVPYMITVSLIALTVLSPFLFFTNIKSLRLVKLSARDYYQSAFLLTLLIVVVGAHSYFILHSIDNSVITGGGRDPVTGEVSLETFLTWAGRLGFDKFWNLIYPAYNGIETNREDISVYIGLIPLIFIVFGLVRARSVISIGFLSAVLVFFFLSLGGRTAEFFYIFFPTARHFRHIGYVVPIFKFFLPFLAGFGVEKILTLSEVRDKASQTIPWAIEGLTAIVLVTESLLYIRSAESSASYIHLLGVLLALILLLFVLRVRVAYERYLPIFLIACLLLGVLGYQGLAAYKLRLPKETLKSATAMVSEYGYQDERGGPFSERMKAASPYINSNWMRYNIAFGLYQYDPCEQQYWLSFANAYVANLFRALNLRAGKTGGITIIESIDNRASNIDKFTRIAGCNSPKLSLASRALRATSESEAFRLINEISDPLETLVLELAPDEIPAGSGHRGGGTIEVMDFRANGVKLEVDVTKPGGQWLYYADSWHPGWKAFINGRPVKVLRANIAFKAIRLEEGLNKVKFVFFNGYSSICAYIILLSGIILICAALIGSVLVINRDG